MQRWLCTIAFASAACGEPAGMHDASVTPADAIDRSIVEAYAYAWGEPDPAARQRLLEYSADPALVLYEPERTLASRDAVATAMTEFLATYPGGTIPIIGNIRELQSRVWLRWNALAGNGSAIATGLDLMKRASDDRIERVHSFYGSLPLLIGTHTPVQQALLDAWNQPDSTMRQALLATAVTDDVVVVNEGQPTVSSRATFSTMIGVALTASPGRTMSVTTGYLSLPSAFHVAWKVVASDGTTELSSGVMFAHLAGDGRIAEAVYFNGAQP